MNQSTIPALAYLANLTDTHEEAVRAAETAREQRNQQVYHCWTIGVSKEELIRLTGLSKSQVNQIILDMKAVW